MRMWLSVSTMLLVLAPHAAAAGPGSVSASVDPRVELMSVIFRLAGAQEYSQGRVESYARDVDAHFAPFRDHPVVEFARTLRASKGISYDAVMAMAVHLSDAFAPDERVPFETNGLSLWDRWEREDAREFVRLAAAFAEASRFREFVEDHRPLYRESRDRMEAFLIEHLDADWFSEFFGGSKGGDFRVVVGLLNGGANYAASFRPSANAPPERYAIIGVWNTDAGGMPVFDEDVIEVVAHEFSHLYVNPLLDLREEALAGPAAAIFEPLEAEMRRQGYSVSSTVLDESVVRAAVILYLRGRGRARLAREQLEEDVRRHFLWLGELVELMEVYERSRDRYENLESFLPRIEAFFRDVRDQLPAMMAEYDARRPKVVSTAPVNGATGVDPRVRTLRITFDRPIERGSYAVLENDPVEFPEVTDVSLDESGTVFRLEVVLQPDRSYGFQLNGPGYAAFKSEDGVPMKPFPYRFTTAPSGGSGSRPPRPQTEGIGPVPLSLWEDSP